MLTKIIVICFMLGAMPLNVLASVKDIDYQKVSKNNQIIHVVKLNPQKHDIYLVQASRSTQSKATLKHLAEQEKASLAINAGFYKIERNGQATSVSALKIGNRWVVGSKLPRAVLGWNNTKTIIDNLMVRLDNNRVYLDPSRTKSRDWQQVQYAVGGVPLLIVNGKINQNYTKERISRKEFINQPHARTAVGVTSQGNWVIVVVEQRYKVDFNKINLSIIKAYIEDQNSKAQKAIKDSLDITKKGMTLHELAQFMLKQNCKYAINLDGGGSTGLYYNNDLQTRVLDNYYGPLVQRQINSAVIVK